jgi:hypothetical protein
MKRECSIVAIALLVLTGISLAGVHIVGGTGYTGNAIPWWGSSYTAMRFQCIWYQTEIAEAGYVTKVELQFHSYSGTPPATFNKVDMLLCHTKLSTITATFADNYSGNTPVNVFSGDWTLKAGLAQNDWVIMCEPAAGKFKYNNTDNLLFEISWEGVKPATTGYFWRANASQPGRLYATTKTATSGSVQASQGEVARITIQSTQSIEPASLGNIRALFH